MYMQKHKHSLWYIYGFAVMGSIIIAGLIGVNKGLSSLITVLILAGIEISFSFENAIINAKILKRMNYFWQQLFMTVGIIFAVFVVRFLVPIILVAVTASLSIRKVTDLALHHPHQYSLYLEDAHTIIAAFGGMFLLMIFLDFVFETRPVMWIEPLEKKLSKLGKQESLSLIVAAGILILTTVFLATDRAEVLFAGVVGLLIYLIINTLESAYMPSEINDAQMVKRFAKAGIVGFLYLELIDASFSMDGVIGAFAITTDIILITAGLAIGALFVRAMTVHLLRRGTLQKYIYLDHGAHYAIGLLALLLLITIRHELPQWLTGLSGILIIGIALADSHIEAKRKNPNATLL